MCLTLMVLLLLTGCALLPTTISDLATGMDDTVTISRAEYERLQRYAELDEIWQIVEQYYYQEPDTQAMLDGAEMGLLYGLGDPYTYYMTAEEYQRFQDSLSDTAVVGIGVMAGYSKEGLVISGVAPDSPATQAGLRVGDAIVAVDGTTLEEAGSSEALALLVPGESGTDVQVTVLRDGQTFTATMTRAEVVFPTATGQVVDGHIGWLEVSSFGENTGDYFEQYILEENEQADRWVVDLRGNPGGYGSAVIQALGYFLGNQNVAYLMGRDLRPAAWRPNPFPVEIPPLTDEPMIVLVDGASASASELFAGAVRDYRAALVIGARTYGKGIAQSVIELEDGSAFKITTDRYYSPYWVTPDRSGVLPNLVVDPDLADGVARLLSGKPVEKAGSDVLVIELVDRQWYVHKDEAVSSDYRAAFAQLLAALAPHTPMTLNGKEVTPAQVSAAWGVDYDSRWFSDVDGTDYADESNALAVLGVLNGDENGAFDPDGELTRAELCALVVQAMGYWCWQSQGRAPFADVPEDAWYANAVDILYHLGLLQGDEKGNFNPDALIDHQQFLTILARVGSQADMTVRQAVTDAAELDHSAAAAFGAWAQDAVLALDELDILLEPLTDMDPTAATTRAEAAALMYNFMAYSGILTSVETGEAAEAAA